MTRWRSWRASGERYRNGWRRGHCERYAAIIRRIEPALRDIQVVQEIRQLSVRGKRGRVRTRARAPVADAGQARVRDDDRAHASAQAREYLRGAVRPATSCAVLVSSSSAQDVLYACAFCDGEAVFQ